ncbi:putative N-acetylated-alpha-linked acidic dipeptidase [Acanthaster planci]|uniref:N-acetylated-alpha-linked acidic dipeptidase n=1 Tax=Acanthaster planci TaxID=133434 RepID=A0A8B7YEW2_ACAPL|nr:putative N-acetylated-alpha-linked acidic dipeptidase [Acanthaster planci]XP_022090182.1 putative N-acetylated-alpha-linked acidic dipeptidase [Acanthaster planci]
MGIDSNNRAGSGAAYSRFAEEMDIDSVNLSMHGSSVKSPGIRGFCMTHWKTLIVLVIALLCFGIGIIMGHFIAGACIVKTSTNGVYKNQTSSPNKGGDSSASPVAACPTGPINASPATARPTNASPATAKSTMQPTSAYVDMINGLIEKGNLRSNLQTYTNGGHHAGSPGNRDKAHTITNTWTSYGFDVVQKNYQVLLSRPNPANPNSLSVYDMSTQSDVNTFIPDDISGMTVDMLQPFAIYGANASITAKPIYVNYGRTEDFNLLHRETELNYSGCICLARLGKIPLAQMAEISKDRNCTALVAFPDPKTYANPNGRTTADSSFPSTWWLPPDAVPRESARLSMGDPSTPFFPSNNVAPRKPLSLVEDFPVLTISYETAKGLLRDMHSPPAIRDWTIVADQTFIGPGFQDASHRLKLDIFNTLSLVDITNVIATIPGTTESDRYVIIGNHRDSFTQGMVSPGTGTACLMEVARVLSELIKKGWRPRRTIILASWDAGEDGLIGSTEWVEENLEKLHSRGVAYINLDDAVSGNYSFAAAGSPLLSKVIFQATQDVSCPDQSHHSMSIHHNWASRRPISASIQQPQLDPLGKSSDSAPFLMLAGVPSVDLQYVYDEEYYNVPRYPTFRTWYDQAQNINLFIDDDFSIHAAVTEVTARVLVTLADTPKLSMKLTDYSDALTRYVQQFKAWYGGLLQTHGIFLDDLETSVNFFSRMASAFQEQFDSIDETDEFTLRKLNDNIMSVERAFLINEGVPFNPESRHLIYSANVTSVYKGAFFGPLSQMIVTEREHGNWNLVEETLGYTILGLNQAANILSSVTS